MVGEGRMVKWEGEGRANLSSDWDLNNDLCGGGGPSPCDCLIGIRICKGKERGIGLVVGEGSLAILY